MPAGRTTNPILASSDKLKLRLFWLNGGSMVEMLGTLKAEWPESVRIAAELLPRLRAAGLPRKWTTLSPTRIPEPVEGPFFPGQRGRKERSFDRLRISGGW